jgi:hypothetical protein
MERVTGLGAVRREDCRKKAGPTGPAAVGFRPQAFAARTAVERVQNEGLE